jgi:NAD+ synthetase
VDRKLLERLRWTRGFDASEVIDAKIGRLTRWFASQRLDAAVVGVSGGVDSALVLALLRRCASQPESPLHRVVALLLPVTGRGSTGQDEATERGRTVASRLGTEIWEAPLTAALDATIASLSRASGLAFDAWSEGQCLSVVRTPALYGAAALLQAHGHRSVVVGTTNRDEGAYLGFFGKGSDGMVDLQPIADLHKSEVRALARRLGIPDAIVDATPSGDVFDGRSDEEMIGASYDDIEIVLRLLELRRDPADAGDRAVRAVLEQHARNAHKYAVGSPAVFLDVLPRGVPGGWPDEAFSGTLERRPPPGAIPGAWDPPRIELDPPGELPAVSSLEVPGALALRVSGALSASDCGRLRDAMAHATLEPVGVTGLRDENGVGSTRATAWAPELAADLWHRLRPAVPSVRFVNALTPTDGFRQGSRTGHRSWRAKGLSPLLRFMRYEPGGRHFGHYDAGFDYGDGRRTLLSVVFFLSTAASSGATRFLRDGQEQVPVAQRDFDDWSREAREDEIAVRLLPFEGDAIVFDHRVCHDVERWEGPGPRIIIRADVVYEAIPDGRA